jgi:hypothetical protein
LDGDIGSEAVGGVGKERQEVVVVLTTPINDNQRDSHLEGIGRVSGILEGEGSVISAGEEVVTRDADGEGLTSIGGYTPTSLAQAQPIICIGCTIRDATNPIKSL